MLNADYSASPPETLTVFADSDLIKVPDAHLLFNAQYSRTAHDLILTDTDGSRLVISGYFDRPDLPSLVSPEGAMLRPDVVTALAGPLAPGQYAQAGGAGGGESIGKVTALAGSVTAQHADGTVVPLKVGDAVFQGDILQSGPQSSIGVVFADDTVFSLSADARMVLNEMVYQPGGDNNSMTFSLVEGSFSFIAGKVAPTGEMKFNTPVASMGIRGTCGGAGTSANGNTQFVLCEDPDGKIGAYALTNLITGELLATVNTTSFAFVLTTSTGQVITIPRSEADQVSDETIETIYQVYDNAVKSGDIQGSNETGEKGEQTAGEKAPPTPEQVLTVGETAFSAGTGDLGDSAMPEMTDAGTETLDGEEGDTTEQDGDSTITDSAEGSTTTETAASIEAEPVIIPDPTNPTPDDVDEEPETPPPPAPVTGTTTEGGSSSTLDPLANSPGGGTVIAPSTLPAGVTFDDSDPEAPSFILDPTDPAYDSLADGEPTTVTVNYQIDNGSTTTPASVQWTVTGENDAPVAADDGSLSTNENTALSNIDVLGNDDDIDGDSLTISGTPTALHGAVTVNLDGTLNYTPDSGYSGPDTITYQVSDGTLTDTGQVTITVVASSNDPPVAVDDGPFATNEDTALNNINVLANDIDNEGPSLSVAGIPTALHGTVTVNGNGTLNYTPDANYNGADTITYVVTDGTSNDTGQVVINVTAVNDAPAGADNTITASEETAHTFTVADFGFTDPNDSPADALAAVIITTTPAAGALTLNGVAVSAGQSVSVADINSGQLVFTPAANASGTGYASFTFQVQDNGGGGNDTDPSANTITINVTAQNDPPVAVDDGPFTTNEDTALNNINVLGNDNDSDGPSLSISGIPTALHGTVTVNGDGTLNYTPDANYNGPDTITYVVTDGTSNDTGQVTINVTAVNDAPAGTNNTLTTNEDTARIFTAADFGFSDPNDSPADAFAAVTITTIPVAGTLTLNGGAVAAGQSVSIADINSGLLVFTPAANADGMGYASFTFQGQDNGGTANGGQDTDPSANTITINVTSVNDAPAGTNNTITTNEETARIFTAADFGFTDPNDDPDNALSAVTITTIPAAGALTLNGVAVSAGQSVSVADINSGLLVFTPAANASGTGYASFTFQVQDNGGVANGGQDTDQSANTITIDVTGLNHAPAGADNTITTNEDTARTFTAADFGFTDPNDSPGNSFAAVTITTPVTSGALTLNGVAVIAGQTIAVTDIDAGLLVFTPDANANGAGYASFTFQVHDDGGTAGGGADTDPSANTITIDVTSVNDAPASASNTIATNEDTARTLTAADFGFNDPNDSPADALAAVIITSTPGSGTLTLNGVAVTAGQSVSAADIDAGLLVFTPDANANGAGYTSFNFQVQDDGGTDNGGADTDPSANTIIIDVTAVNDAPEGTDNTVATNEGTGHVFTSADFGSSDPSDSPSNDLAAVVIATIPTEGALTLNGAAVTAGQSVSAADIDAGLLVFTPAGNASGAGYASFTFQVKDDGGTANSGQDTDQSANTITIDVAAVNHAPAGADNTITTNEDTARTLTAADFGFSDASDSPADAFAAVLITTTPASGVLTLDGIAVLEGQSISVADINAGLLVFTPDANANGADHASFMFQVQDNGGTANGGDDTDPSPNTITVDVTSVNDAPTGTDNTITATEDTARIFAAVDFGFTDPNDSPANAFSAVTITTTPVAGALTLNGVAVTAGQSVSVADINAGLLVFTPAANANGTGYTSFTFQVQDNGGGLDTDPSANTITINVTAVNDPPVAVNDGPFTTNEDTALNNINVLGNDVDVDGPALSISGTPTALYGTVTVNPDGTLNYTPYPNYNGADTITYTVTDGTFTDTGEISISVSPIPDPPVAVDDGPFVTDEDTPLNNIDVLFNDFDVDAQFPSISGTPTALHGTVTVNPDGTLNYTPNANFNGADTITYQVTDGTFTDTAQVAITVNPVNDAPVAVDDGPFSVGEDATLSNINVLGNDTDVDVGDTLSISGKPTVLHLTIPGTALPPDLVARWTADGTAEDAVSNNDGVLQNGASFTSGNFGQAFHFDGVDDVVVAPSTGLPVGNSDRTISLWMKADTFGSGETFLAGYGNFGASGQTYQLGTSGDTLFFSQWGDAVFGPSLEAGQWYHIAVTNVGDSVTLYVDGVAVATDTLNINTPAGTDFLIGARPTVSVPGLLQGDVDDIQVYDRALTAEEIQSVYNAGAVTAEHGTVTVNPDGTLNYTPDPDFSGTDTITYVVTDGTSTDTGQVTITVNAVNDAPLVTGAVTGLATEGGATSTLDALAEASDVDSPVLSVVNLPPSLPAGVTYNAGTHSFTLDPTDPAYDSLADGQTTTVTVSYDVSDGEDTTPASVSWTLTGTNDAPIVSNLDATTTSTEGMAGIIDSDVTISDDAFNYDGSTLTVARTGSPEAEDSFSFSSSTNFTVDGSTLENQSGDVIANFSTGNSLVITFTALATAALVDDVAQHIAYANTSDAPPASIVLDYTYSDGELSDTESITVDITAVNDGPFVTPDSVITNIAPGNLIVIPEQALLANDIDLDGGGPLDVNGAGGASGGTVVHGPGSGPTGIVEVTDTTSTGTTFIYNATDGSAVGEFGVVTVSFDLDGALEGAAGTDILIGADGGTMLVGHGGDDQLVGGVGRDIYVWSANDGYDTILPNGGGVNEDIIKVRGSFYDYDWRVEGDDLIIGVVADDNYEFAGGNLRIKDFLAGGDSIDYLTADLGDNNGFYSPGGGDARIYVSAITGTDQGNYFETIVGTDDSETMEGNGGAIDWFNARGGDDQMSVSDGTQGFFRAGDGDDTMTGADQNDQFIGGDGEDTIIGNSGTDEVRYDRGAGSSTPLPNGVGVTVNVGTSITLSIGGPQIQGGEAVDNWGKTDQLTDIENVRGSDFNDAIVGSDANNQLRGLRGDDILVGREGADFYRWSLNDGYDTILADGGAPNEDVIRLDGGFYDFNWELDGNDLIVGAAVDANGEWSDAGGNLRLKDFVLPGGDTIDYLTANLGPENNEFYSPDGNGIDARLYLSAVNGNNQGSFTELIVGTDAGETMVGGGGAADRLMGGGGNDIMSVSAGTRGHFTGGDGDDQMTGGNQNDVFRGGDGADIIIGGGGNDEARYDTRADSTALPTQGVTVNLGTTVTIAGVNGGMPIAGTTAIDSWGKTDTLTSIERVRGSAMADLLVGSGGSNRIQGMGGDDTLIGRGGADTYVWSANDGYDTILSNGSVANEDIIQINGSFYDLNWEKDGNDLIVGAAVDDNYVWADAGGNLRIQDFFTGTDTIDYLTGNVGANNEFYSPGGGEDARIYLSAVNGTDQGNYFEAIVGTAVGETMAGNGGAIDHLSGGGGDDIMSVDANTFGIFRGGDGEDEMTGGDMEDNFVGGAGNDAIIGGNGLDEVRYDRPGGSDPGGMTQGVVVNIGTTIAVDVGGVPTLLQGFTAQDNWGDQDSLSGIENARGSALEDVLVGSDDGNEIRGMAGDDLLIGRGGGDTYVWSAGDGYDTILADESAPNEDVIRLNGSFYDFNWEYDGDDLIVGGAVDDNYVWADAGGNLRIKDFFTTGDTIAYVQGDFGPNNSYFNIDGSDGPADIYLSAVSGTDQGDYSELILGTSDADTMEGNGGAFDIFYGEGGNDTMTVANGTRGNFRGGDGNDTMTGADQDDSLRGSAGDDTLDGGDGIDQAQYDRRSGSLPFTHGAFVNLSAVAATMVFEGNSTVVAAAHALDNWGNTDSLSNIENVQGSDFDDIVLGSAENNFINVAGGNDRVWAGAGDDEVLGGDGNDELHGELGENDILQGYAGDDVIDGGLGEADAADYYDDPNGVTVNLATGTAKDGYGGTDTLQDVEQIYASFYDDLLTGNDQNNWIDARDGDDIVFGGAGRDDLLGGNGDDDLHGGDDDDTLEGGAGNDLLDGGSGRDTASYYSDPDAVTVDLAAGTATDGYGNTDTLVNVESIHGSAFNDTLSGDDGDNFIEGGAGDDTLYAGDNGFDTVSYVNSPSAVSINLAAGDGNDGYGGFDIGLGSFDSVLGSHYNDTLVGNNFENVIEGFGGDDQIHGDEAGQEAPGDMASYYSDPTGVTANLISGIVSDGYGGTDTLVDIEGIIGSAFSDTLTGTGSGNRIEARDGDDTIYFPDINGASVDGGSGQDLVAFIASGADASLGSFEIHGVETIDLTGLGNNYLQLSGDDVAVNGASNAVFTSAAYADNLVIEGDSGDQVTLFDDAGWEAGATDVALDGSGPGNYNIYNYTEGSVTASLAVDHDVAVVIAPV